VCRASHRSRAFEQLRTTYGQSTVGKDGTTSGWLTDNGALLQRLVNRYSVDWRTADMQVCSAALAGNPLLCTTDAVHCKIWDPVRAQPCLIATRAFSVLAGLVNGPSSSYLSLLLICMQAGDVVILHPELMHMSAANISGSIRLSCDTRWQPESGARDPRFRHWHAAQGPVQSANGLPAN
jgi:hypothetical protein